MRGALHTVLISAPLPDTSMNSSLHRLLPLGRSAWLLTASGITALCLSACSQSTSPSIVTTSSQYAVVTLTSDDVGAPLTDPALVNAWGIVVDPLTGNLIVASNHGSVASLYDSLGAALGVAVQIPSADSVAGGAPTGVTANATTTDFNIPGGGASSYIFAGEDGTISAWSVSMPTHLAVKVFDNSSTAVNKGIAILNHKLFVADIKGGARRRIRRTVQSGRDIHGRCGSRGIRSV